MFESVQEYAVWLESLAPTWIYVVLALTAYLENLIPPFPGDVSVVVAGYLVGVGLIDLVPTIGFTAVASTLGFMTMFAVGWRLGEAVEDPKRLRWIPKGPVGTARRWLTRWGYGVVLVNRFLSGTRAVLTLLAGAAHLRAGLTAACAAFSALVWTAFLVYAGYSVGANWEQVLGILQAYGQVITALGIIVVAGLGGRWWWRYRYSRKQRVVGRTVVGSDERVEGRHKETAKTLRGEDGQGPSR